MRLPLFSPSELSPEQRPLYDDMRKGIETNFKGFIAINGAGQLIGPWNPWIRFPKFGGPVWELVKSLSTAVLPALTYQQAVRLFGEEGTAEFIYLVGLYCMGSVTLNGFDVPVPEVDGVPQTIPQLTRYE